MTRLKSFFFTIMVSLSLVNIVPARAQAPTDLLLSKAMATDELLPLLIDSALKYSPELRRTGNNEDYANANLQSSKKAIFSAFSLQSSYNYGTNYSAINNQTSPIGGSNLTTSQTGFYNLGVGLQLPITYILNRKNILKASQSQVNMATAQKDNTALMIKQEVIRLYQEFKLSQKLMTVSTKNRQTAGVNNTMAEKDFLNGQISVDKVATVLESYNKSIIEFETYANRFQTSYMQLEAFTGINLSSLIGRVK